VRSIAGDRGKKEASKEVGEEKRKRKRLYVLREKEIEDKRKHDEELQTRSYKARAVIGPCSSR
jgi:translation initiation factor IF-2